MAARKQNTIKSSSLYTKLFRNKTKKVGYERIVKLRERIGCALIKLSNSENG